jgi:uncharacterized protein YneF (UPF0154 family)
MPLLWVLSALIVGCLIFVLGFFIGFRLGEESMKAQVRGAPPSRRKR